MSPLIAMLVAASIAPSETVLIGPGGLAPGLTQGEQGVAVSWLEPVDGGHRLLMAEQRDGGWGAPVTILQADSLLANWADAPRAASSVSGIWLATVGRRGAAGHAVDVEVLTSSMAGWRSLGSPHDDGTPTEHGFASLVADGPGFQVAWLDGRATAQPGGAMELRTARVEGSGIGPSIVLDARVCDCCGTAMARTAHGAIVAYRGRSAVEIRDIWVVRQMKGQWSKPTRVSSDGWKIAGCPVNGPAIAARGTQVAVAWYTYAGAIPRVRVAFSSNSGESFGKAIDIDGPHERVAPVGRVGIALESSGTAVVSWVASTREDAQVLVRRASAAGLVGDVLPIGATKSDRQSGVPRIVLDGNTLVVARTSEAGVQLSRVPVSDIPVLSTKPSTLKKPAALLQRVALSTPAQMLDGSATSLGQLEGQPVLVNFWATWCEPCRTEIPELVALDLAYRARGLKVIGVSLDKDLTSERIRAFAERRGVGFTLWRDPEEALAGAMGVNQLPATFLLNERGALLWSSVGALTATDPGLVKALQNALSP